MAGTTAVEVLGPATVMIIALVTTGWIVRTVSINRRHKAIATAQIEAHTKLLERFGSAEEAQRYLESEAGKRFLELAATDKVDPIGRVLKGVHQGVVLTMAGAAMLASRSLMEDNDGRAFITMLGYLGIFVGAGSLVSAGLSFVLLRRFGNLRSSEHDS